MDARDVDEPGDQRINKLDPSTGSDATFLA
jgi:hypothetical protein